MPMFIPAPGILKPCFAQASLVASLVLLSNPAFGCQGQDYQQTERIYQETMRLRNEALATGNIEPLFKWQNEAVARLRRLPVSCQAKFEQAMAPYQPQGPDWTDQLPW